MAFSLARIFRAPALAITLVLSAPMDAQVVNVAGHPIEFHGFFSQGFTKSNDSNYLTMQSSKGAFDFTDGGINISTRLTDKLRVGAQGYVRNIGQLGNGHIVLDWATADYRFKDYFGVRAGRVKTVLGLYNDTQDLEFLHTWALLPQAIYPLDLRGMHLSHLGGDVYGSITPQGKKWGTFSYTAYIGKTPADPSGGRTYGLASYGWQIQTIDANQKGADVKWNTPLPGLLAGVSFLSAPENLAGTDVTTGTPLAFISTISTVVYSGQFSRKGLRLDYEWSRELLKSTATGTGSPAPVKIMFDRRAWYVGAAYRISPHVELGSYHSRFYPNADRPVANAPPLPPESRHMYDQVFAGRFDFKTYWDLKLEGHFMDGYGMAGSSRGLYPQDNPQGLNPHTKLLVIRLGFNY